MRQVPIETLCDRKMDESLGVELGARESMSLRLTVIGSEKDESSMRDV
jgi:hypothetical protein